MVGNHHPWRMSEAAVDAFLDTFELEGCAELFNQLYVAAQQAYGEDFPPRVTSIRGLTLVVNNPGPFVSPDTMLSASVEEMIAAQAMEQGL